MTDLVDVTRQTYDRIAQQYDEKAGAPTPELLAFREGFASRVRGPVADLGCGPGRDLARMRESGLDVLGIDLSAGMLALARTRGPVVLGDLRRPPLRPGSLGGIWSSASLLHVPRQDVPAALGTWHTLLSPDGVLGLSTALGDAEGWEPVPYDLGVRRWFVHHEEDALVAMLREVGFEVLSAERRTTHRHWLMVLAGKR